MLRLGIIEEKNGNSATKLLATSFSNKFLNKIYIRFVETSFLFSHQKRKDQIYLQLPSSRGPLGNYFPKPHSKQSSVTFNTINWSLMVDQSKNQGRVERNAKKFIILNPIIKFLAIDKRTPHSPVFFKLLISGPQIIHGSFQLVSSDSVQSGD